MTPKGRCYEAVWPAIPATAWLLVPRPVAAPVGCDCQTGIQLVGLTSRSRSTRDLLRSSAELGVVTVAERLWTIADCDWLLSVNVDDCPVQTQ